ncbi:MAG: DUF4157 domain-containing protein [Candidatus Accumulibacter sp.]|uniref:eCIS core domain-containing protein n=1 Tax=Accumulibacter sp. TaxID=2053492 RepID=UPI001A5FEA9A|nr:DUF4157 domain-containing protein [Accumulibacter sp.]MBL8393184.1 DUF4157 domain-containing protein [Accumulibacter sp.]
MHTHLIRLRSRATVSRGVAPPHPQHARTAAERLSTALGSPLQTKLTLGAPGDAHEREADAVAERVLRMPAAVGSLHPVGEGIQRMCSECEEEEAVQRKTAEEESEEEEVQTKASANQPAGGQLATTTATAIQSQRGRGQQLPASERAFFEPRFGTALDKVVLHTDGGAADLSSRLSARAFTVGRDVFFGSGEYRPGTPSGRHLLAHELTHVLQQDGASATPVRRLSISQYHFHQGTCGERNVQWVFSLDAPAATDGYIVQKVAPTEVTMGCGIFGGMSPSAEVYWEAWKIKKGDKVDWTTTRDSWTDGSSYPAHPNGLGNQITPGLVKFFPISTTGDLGDFGVAPATSNGWGPGKVKRAGDLPSTASEPSWWGDKPVEGPATRMASLSWACCDPDPKKHTSEVKAKP